jgi:hypothetical protein
MTGNREGADNWSADVLDVYPNGHRRVVGLTESSISHPTPTASSWSVSNRTVASQIVAPR